MTDTRIIKLPTWEECDTDPSARHSPIGEFIYQNEPAPEKAWREMFALTLNEAAKAGAKAAKEGKEVRYEP